MTTRGETMRPPSFQHHMTTIIIVLSNHYHITIISLHIISSYPFFHYHPRHIKSPSLHSYNGGVAITSTFAKVRKDSKL